MFRSHFGSKPLLQVQALLLRAFVLSLRPQQIFSCLLLVVRNTILKQLSDFSHRMFMYGTYLLFRAFATYSTLNLAVDQQQENIEFHSPLHEFGSRSITRHIPIFYINMVAGAGEPPTRRTRRGDAMDGVTEEDDMDMDLENLDTATPVPTSAMPTTNPITTPTITTSMMKGSK